MEYKEYRNPKSKAWDFAMSQRMDFYIEQELIQLDGTNYEEVIQSAGKLLQYPLAGGLLYDLVLDMLDKNPNRARIKASIKSICDTVGMYDFILEARNLIIRPDYGPTVLSKLIRTVTLVIKGYNLGRVEAVNSKNNSVIIAPAMDSLDLEMAIVVEINNRPKVKNNLNILIKLYDTDKKRYVKYLRTVDHCDMVNTLTQTEDHQLVALMNTTHNANRYSYVNHLFYEYNEDFMPDYDLLESAPWEREEVNKGDSAIMDFFKYIVNTGLAKDVLRERKFFVREKGVRIEFVDTSFDIKSMDIREYHSPDGALYEEHYLVFFYTTVQGGTRMMYLDMSNLEAVTVPLMYEKDAEVSLYILAWLGILNTAHFTEDMLKANLVKQNLAIPSDSTVRGFTDNLNKLVDHAVNVMHPDNYTYFTPAQWNYDFKGSQKATSIFTPTAPRKLVQVGRYSRKLPAGQVASVEAKELARKCYIELKEGYTLVDEHEKVARRSNK